VKEKSPEEFSRDILVRYIPVLNDLKNVKSEERTLRIVQLRSELSNIKDQEVASKVLWELYRRDLLSEEEFERLRRFL
jgi:rhomboid protease GluP